jgi:hypothetical protein
MLDLRLCAIASNYENNTIFYFQKLACELCNGENLVKMVLLIVWDICDYGAGPVKYKDFPACQWQVSPEGVLVREEQCTPNSSFTLTFWTKLFGLLTLCCSWHLSDFYQFLAKNDSFIQNRCDYYFLIRSIWNQNRPLLIFLGKILSNS